jgi:hypothetical protein
MATGATWEDEETLQQSCGESSGLATLFIYVPMLLI